MIERLTVAAPLIALVLWVLYAVRRRSPLEPSILLLGTTALVGVFFPIGAALVKPLTWRHGAHLPNEVVLATQWQFLAFAAGVALIVARVRWRRVDSTPSRAPAPQDAQPSTALRDLVVSGGLVIGGGLLYALYVHKVGLGPLLDRHNFAEKYRVSSGLGALYFGLNLVIVGCLWAESSAFTGRMRRAFRAVAAAVLVWSFAFVAVRTYAVALFLGYLYIACRRSEFSLSRIRPWVVVVLLVGYVGVESYAMLRGAWRGSLVEAMQTLEREQRGLDRSLGQVIGGSELSHPFLTAMELREFEEAGALGGSSYVGALLGMLPLSLYPDRPPTPAQDFARRHYPALEARGGGTAFSIVGEAWWNFGSVLGPFAIGLLLAALLLHLERTADARPTGIIAHLLPYFVHMVLLVHRGSSVSVAKHLFSILMPIALLLSLAHILWRGLGHRPSPVVTFRDLRPALSLSRSAP